MESRRISGNRTAEDLVREYFIELNKKPTKPKHPETEKETNPKPAPAIITPANFDFNAGASSNTITKSLVLFKLLS